jgi:UDP-2,3-diacylglucosamine hydrolase
MQNHKKIFFASDFHLGMPDQDSSLEREKKIVRWLESIEDEASAIFLMGDIFDFWFEYRRVVPKGFIRFLGKLAFLADKGVKLYISTGNHDQLMFSYLKEQLNVSIHYDPQIVNLMGKNFYLDHGEHLRGGISRVKLVRGIFKNSVCQWFFSWFHPDLGVGLASYLLSKNRILKSQYDDPVPSEKNEWMINHAKYVLKIHPKIDCFIFGHLHLPLFSLLNDIIYCINLGDWITHCSYAVFDGRKIELRFYDQDY